MRQSFFSQIAGVGHYVPEKLVTNEDLAKVMDTSHSWIVERTGIEQRRIASVDEACSDLGFKAAQKALENAGIVAADVDLILAATLSPDYYFPGIGVLIQDKLGAKYVPAIDIRGQCSGFAWSLATADAYIRSGLYKKVLVVGAEIHSRIIEFSNRGRNVSVLFGDGAASVVVERGDSAASEYPTATNKMRGLIDHVMGSDGSGASQLIVKRPGLAAGFDDFITGTEAAEKAYLPYMEGQQVFRNAVTRMYEAAETILTRNNISPQDIDLLIPHQANLRINDMLRQKMGLAEEKVFNNIQKYGNTTSATLPLCMSEAQAQGLLKKGDLVLTVAFGSGFTWGANLLRW